LNETYKNKIFNYLDDRRIENFVTASDSKLKKFIQQGINKKKINLSIVYKIL